MSTPHSSKLNLFCTTHKDQTTSSKAQTSDSLSGRSTRKHTSLLSFDCRRLEPEEDVRQTPHDREGEQEVTPECVDLDGVEVRLCMRGHRDAGDTYNERWEGIERAGVAVWFFQSLLVVVSAFVAPGTET